MIKIKTSSEQIHSQGGIFITHEILKRYGIDKLIDKHIGPRGTGNGYSYSYSDIVLGLVYSQHCGATCIEDIQQMVETFTNHPGFKMSSPDTVLRMFDELKTETIVHTSKTGVKHEFNSNLPLNDLLQKICTQTKVISTKEKYTLDYDNTINLCNKYDAKRTYKNDKGYQPGVGSINNIPIFVEGRNGNSPAKYLMADTINQLFDLTNKNDIEIAKFRSDSAAYQQDVIELMEDRHITFYIRAINCEELRMQIKEITEWKAIQYNFNQIEIAEMWYSPFGGEKKYRVIVQRKKNKAAQLDAFSESVYEYYSIITLDTIGTPEEIYTFYNQRGGTSEDVIDILKNDFNWNHLPCSFLNQNTVFMILSAISYVLTVWMKTIIGKHIKGITQKGRLKQYMFMFINVAAKWIHSGSQTILKIFSNKGYEFILLKI